MMMSADPSPNRRSTSIWRSLRLTRRQNEILPLLAQGMSNKEIARELSIAEGTSKIHTAALLRALCARNRTEAAFIAAKLVGPRDRLASRDENKSASRSIGVMAQAQARI